MMRGTQGSGSELCLDREHRACGSVTWALKSSKALHEGLPFTVQSGTGGVVPTQFLQVLLRRTPNRTNPTLSFLCV